MKNLNNIPKMSVRSVIVLILVIGALLLAIIDENSRPIFGDLAKVGVGGYLGQLMPQKQQEHF